MSAQPALPVSLSTDGFALRERAPLWQEWIAQRFGGLACDLYGDTEFAGHMHTQRAGGVVMTRLQANRHRVERTCDMVRQSDAGYLKIVAPFQGRAGVEQMSRQAWARAGNWTIYDTTGSYTVANPETVDHLIVMLPKSQMQETGLPLERLMARLVDAHSGISRVALAAMRNTFDELAHMSPAAAQGAGELIMQLVRLSLLELAGTPTGVSQRQALRDRIQSYVSLHLGDPALCVEQIAWALNCSKRHLHNAFVQEEETLAAYILRLRLQRCKLILEQNQYAVRTVSQIAQDYGFSSPAHFSRVFRAHTGQSPQQYRQTYRQTQNQADLQQASYTRAKRQATH
jgi:AraC-like DNA-binding protein